MTTKSKTSDAGKPELIGVYGFQAALRDSATKNVLINAGLSKHLVEIVVVQD